MEAVYSYKNLLLPASFKDADPKKGVVSGYFAKFDNVDSDGDIIRKGAFSKTILETGPASSQPRIKHLQNHNPGQPLGKLISLSEDTKGLAYESQIGTHTLGQDFIKMVESGLITEHSIGFRTVKRNQLQDYEGYMKNPDKGWFELAEVKLWEGSSLTAWGANPLTPITGIKGVGDIQTIVDRQKAIEKFCRQSTATDELIELLLIESKQLTQFILDISTEPKHTLPDEVKQALTTFKNSLINSNGI